SHMTGASTMFDPWYLAALFSGPVVAAAVLLLTARSGTRRTLLALSIGTLALLAMGVALRAYALGFVLPEYATPMSGDGDPRNLAFRIGSAIVRPAGFYLGLAMLVVILLATTQRQQWLWLVGLAVSSVLLVWSYADLYGNNIGFLSLVFR